MAVFTDVMRAPREPCASVPRKRRRSLDTGRVRPQMTTSTSVGPTVAKAQHPAGIQLVGRDTRVQYAQPASLDGLCLVAVGVSIAPTGPEVLRCGS